MTDKSSGIYGEQAHAYRAKGYSPLPLPKNRKKSPPDGWTGSQGLFASGADIQEWIEADPDRNVALRLPRGVVGIDVDDYGIKTGATSMRHAIEQVGSLPNIGRLTSRYEEDRISGIRLYRVPENIILAAQFSSAGLGPDVEIVQFHHRYCVGPGSIHPDTGLPYRWVLPDGSFGELPAVDELPELPPEWITALQPKKSERPASDVDHAAYDALDEAEQNRIQTWMERALAGIYGELEEMKRWPAGHRNSAGEGWEDGVLARTGRLAQLVNADWNTLTTDEVLRDLKKHLPHDPSFPIEQSLGKFVRGLPKLDPAYFPAGTPDLMSGLEDRSKTADGDPAPRDTKGKARGLSQFAVEFPIQGCFKLDEEGKPTGKIKPATTARALAAAWPIAKQALTRGREWWAFYDGVWRPNSEIVRGSLALSFKDYYETKHVAPVEDILATTADEIVIEPHPDFINFRNGMLEWRTGELHEHDPDYHSTVQIPHSWNPDAECPLFDAWLADRLSGPGVQLAWELLAISLYSGNPIQRAGLLYGVGKSGKSTYLEVAQGLVGARNCSSLSPHDMTKTVFATHSLLGKQTNIVTDIDPTKVSETAIFKRAVASETMQAQQKNRPEFTFKPFCNHLYSANQIMRTADRTSAWTRRFAILRFALALGVDVRIVENYHRVLLEEAEGIIAKAVKVLPNLLWAGDFSVIPDDQDEFETATDFTREFWEDAVTITGDADHFVATVQLIQAFDLWCNQHRIRNAPPFTDIELRLRDDERVTKSRGKRPAGKSAPRGWKGLQVNPDYRVITSLPGQSDSTSGFFDES